MSPVGIPIHNINNYPNTKPYPWESNEPCTRNVLEETQNVVLCLQGISSLSDFPSTHCVSVNSRGLGTSWINKLYAAFHNRCRTSTFEQCDEAVENLAGFLFDLTSKVDVDFTTDDSLCMMRAFVDNLHATFSEFRPSNPSLRCNSKAYDMEHGIYCGDIQAMDGALVKYIKLRHITDGLRLQNSENIPVETGLGYFESEVQLLFDICFLASRQPMWINQWDYQVDESKGDRQNLGHTGGDDTGDPSSDEGGDEDFGGAAEDDDEGDGNDQPRTQESDDKSDNNNENIHQAEVGLASVDEVDNDSDGSFDLMFCEDEKPMKHSANQS